MMAENTRTPCCAAASAFETRPPGTFTLFATSGDPTPHQNPAAVFLWKKAGLVAADVPDRKALGRYKQINRELAFTEKQVRKSRVASLPCYLAIDTTAKCNLECKMCFRSYVDVDYNATPDLPVEILDCLIDDLFPTAITLNLSALGEPFMSPYMDKLLDACAAYQVYLSVTRTGPSCEVMTSSRDWCPCCTTLKSLLIAYTGTLQGLPVGSVVSESPAERREAGNHSTVLAGAEVQPGLLDDAVP